MAGMANRLAEWFLTQLDEDERVTRAAPRGPWSMDGAGSIVDVDGARVICSVGGTLDGRVSRWPEGPAAEHVLSHDPERVLREIEAKRQIVRAYEDAVTTFGSTELGTVPHDLMTGAVNSLRRTVQLLALSYADRPGFKEEWRP
jgi:hypothetical protein